MPVVNNFSNLLLTISSVFFVALSQNTPFLPPTSSSPSIIITPLKNKRNNGYYFPMHIGEANKNNVFEMLLDLSMPWTWIPDVDCFNCFRTNIPSKTYDCSYNTGTCHQNISKGIKALEYPSGSVFAFGGSDHISFPGLTNKTSLKHDVSFALKVTESFYNMNADGVFGLGFHEKTDSEGYNKVTSIVSSMYEQGMILEKSFALFLTDNPEGEDEASQIIFGGYNPAKIAPGESFLEVPVTSTDKWTIQLNGMELGESEVQISPSNATLSTTFADIGVPETEFNNILLTLERIGVSCVHINPHPNSICPCPENDLSAFPPLTFQLENTTLVIPNHVYIAALALDVGYGQNTTFKKDQNCILKFRKLDANGDSQVNWIFGRNFLSFYHTLFDLNELKVKFAMASSSDVSEGFSVTLLVCMICIVVLFLIGSISFFIYKCYKASKSIEEGTSNLTRNMYHSIH